MTIVEKHSSIIDIASAFSPCAIGDNLARLWTARGCQLEPTLNSKGEPYICPISLAPVNHPVLLSDGLVYEESSAMQLLESKGHASGVAAPLSHKQLLRLAPLRIAIEQFLHSSNVGYYPSEQLEQAMGVAEMPGLSWHKRLTGLENCVAMAKQEMHEITARLSEAQELLPKLQAEFLASRTCAATCLQASFRGFRARKHKARLQEQDRCLRMWQSRMKSFSAMLQLRGCSEESECFRESAVLHIQRWWRSTSKALVKRAKRRRVRSQKKTVTDASALPSQNTPPSPIENKQASIQQQWRINGAIQQFAMVMEKDKRAFLDFFLTQLGYESKHYHIIIFVNSEHRATGLCNGLRMSPSVEFPLLLVEQADQSEYVHFRSLSDGISIIPTSNCSLDVSIAHANMVVFFDMPNDADEYLDRAAGASKGATVMSLPVSDEELLVIRQLEKRFDVKIREMSGLAKLKKSQNREAFKRRLAATGSGRRK